MTDDPFHDDARTAYLFQCGESNLFAMSLDETGANIPTAACADGWRFRESFQLGVHEPLPVAIAPEPILRGIKANGYFIWHKGAMFGTSQ